MVTAPPGPPSSGASREADQAQWAELTGKSGAPIGVQRRAVDVPLPGAAAGAAAIAALPSSQTLAAVTK